MFRLVVQLWAVSLFSFCKFFLVQCSEEDSVLRMRTRSASARAIPVSFSLSRSHSFGGGVYLAASSY